jgi:glycosyltransferase involved in cell wall biosynthesis
MHLPLQRLNRLLPVGMKRADQILVAGGQRTRLSLKTAGCPEAILTPSLDCGIKDSFLEAPRVTHAGENLRFIHFGRLVFHKGTVLIIESLPKTRLRICLDIVGRGEQLELCQQRARELGLGDRVRFLGWYTAQEDLFKTFTDYRGVVLPSFEDANGIVIQEAMALGLPPVCLDWGGPSLLIEHRRTGFLVEPKSLDQITTDLAQFMDLLAADGDLAEEMSQAGRAAAKRWRWSMLAGSWLAAYPKARR